MVGTLIQGRRTLDAECKVEIRRLRLKSLTVGGEEEVRGVLLRQPADLVDLLLDLQTLKVVELGLVALEGAVDIVLAL